MKTRQGFVSNSSSSSFIVCFDKVPTSIEETKEMLFGNKKEYNCPFDWFEPNHYPTEQVAETVFNDMKSEATDEELLKEFENEWYFDLDCFDDKNGKTDWNKWEKENNKQGKIEFEKFKKQNPGKYFIFEYGDDSGEYFSALEHGDLFENLPHVKISNH